MNISTPLFEGQRVQLGPVDHEKDAEIEAGWTHDPAYQRMLFTDAMRPLSPWQMKKRYEALEKNVEEQKDLFPFRVRARSDGRLIGSAELYWIAWSNQAGFIRLGIGAEADRRKGYGRETLQLLLRYAFAELNLYRLTALIPEYNEAALGLFRQAGFVEEVRRREALNRDGRRWDLFHYGLLESEWRAGRSEEV